MRYTPAAMALSLLLAVTSSVSWSAPSEQMSRQASTLLGQGRSALAAGNIDGATDAFEAALAVQPGHPAILLPSRRRQGHLQPRPARWPRSQPSHHPLETP